MRIKALKVPKNLRSFSQSQMSDFASCRQKWLLRVNGLVNPLTSDSTSFGTVFHYLLQCLYGWKKPVAEITESVVTKWLECFQKENAECNVQDMEWDCAIAETVFFKYLARFGQIDFDGKEYFMVEQRIAHSKEPRYAIIDAGFNDHKGRVYIMEHKTRSRIDEEKLSLLLGIDFQNLSHVTLMDDYLLTEDPTTKRSCNGVLYNIIRKPQLKRGENSIAEYCQRVATDIDTRPEFYFLRQEITFTPTDKTDFTRNEMAGILNEMSGVILGKGKIYRSPTNCTTPFGTCDYLEACASGNCDCLIKRTTKRKG